MSSQVKLSQLVEQVQDAIQCRLENRYFWVSAQVTAVKKYDTTKRCYLTLSEIENGNKIAEIKGVFWHTYYDEIAKFEKATGQAFKEGIEVICKVMVKFNKVYGLTVECFQLDVAHTIGNLELLKQQTIDRLVKEKHADLVAGYYKTKSNQLQLPAIIKNIALITAPNSDGQRDFIQELTKNKHGYTFNVEEFLTIIQGDNAHLLILEQLKLVESGKFGKFDVVAIVRGGGAQTDFKPFDQYELAQYVANFPVPVFTGIGHDRNQSIVDLMAREQKTPTKVASVFIDHNFSAENKVVELGIKLQGLVNHRLQKAKDKLSAMKLDVFKSAQSEIKQERTRLTSLKANTFRSADNNIRLGVKRLKEVSSSIFKMADNRIKFANINLGMAKQTVKLSDPQNILNRGFAIVTFNDKVVTDPNDIEGGVEIQARLKNGIIHSIVVKK